MSTLFNLPAHNAFVRRHGETVQIKKGVLCPCGTGQADAARANVVCTYCYGLGTRYLPPIDAVGMVTGISRQRDLIEAGIAEPGDALYSPPPNADYQLSVNDIMIIPGWPGDAFQGQLVVRRTGTLTDVLHYSPVDIKECFTIDAITNVLTNYTSFTMSDRLLTWGTVRPADGKIYSLSYTAQIEFVVFVRPQQRLENGDNLGSKVLLRPRHAIAPVL